MVHLYRSRRHDCLPSGAPYALTHPHQESPSVSRGVVPCEEVWLSAREARERSVGGCVCVCGGIERLDPREEGMVLLWAYASRASWPSYHDATGAFPLPGLGF